MRTAAERLRVVDHLRAQHPEKHPDEITELADLVARTHPQFRAGRRRSMLIQAIPWIIAGALGIFATKEAKCQTTTIYLENGGTQQAGGPATYRFNCDGSTVICNWNASTRTWTITSSGGGGGSPGGSNTDIQFNDSGSFGGAADFTYDPGSDVVAFTPSQFSGYVSITDNVGDSAFALGVTPLYVIINDNTDPGSSPGVVYGEVLQYNGNSSSPGPNDVLLLINAYANDASGQNAFNAFAFCAACGAFNEAGFYQSATSGSAGYEAGIEIYSCSGGGTLGTGYIPAPGCAEIILDDMGTTGFPIYQMGTGDTSVFEGTVDIGALVLGGYTCSRGVGGVISCN